MPLAPIQLDTLNWDQIVTAIRKRIVPDSSNNWTLHAPVDPGITLLELFAWLLDQRIYWMDQTPDALVLAILSLLGVSPKAAQAAVTVLRLQDNSSPPRAFPVAASGTLMQLGDSNPPLLFTLDNDSTLLPVDSIGLRIDSLDRTNDLQQGHPIALLPAGKTAAQIGIVLTLSSAIPASTAGQFFSLMIELATPAGEVPPEWTGRAVSGVPAPATLSWSYTSAPSGATMTFPQAQVHDGTAGLRRSGVVRLPLPGDWQPEPQDASGSTTSYKVLLQITNAGFTFTPLLLSLAPNAVLAHHVWQRRKKSPTSKWRPLPGNVISLSGAPSDSSLKEYPPIENTVQLHLTERDGKCYPWRRVDDLSLSGPTDRVFLLDRVRSEISFGDGLTGRLPVVTREYPADATVSYQAGGGTAGNVGQGLFWEARAGKASDQPPNFTAVNLAPGDGGAESETLDLAKARASAALNERNRAVSKPDYENLVQTTPGVGFRRAYAAIGYHPDFPCSIVPGAVTVFVVPYAPRVQIDGDWAKYALVAAPQPDPGALQAARACLDHGRLIGGDVFICGPIYRSVWLALVIAVDALPSTALRESIITGLQNYLDPLVGGDHSDGWPFGNPLRPTALLRVAQDVVGTAGDVESVSVRLDGMTTAESCRDVPIRPYELVSLAHVDLHTRQRLPHSGGLR
jgi:predicted phage baseplate assembly protein